VINETYCKKDLVLYVNVIGVITNEIIDVFWKGK
jgi:hypothetical protein